MKQFLTYTIAFVLLVGGAYVQANAGGNPDRPDYTKEGPNPGKTDYEKVHDFIKEQREKRKAGFKYRL